MSESHTPMQPTDAALTGGRIRLALLLAVAGLIVTFIDLPSALPRTTTGWPWNVTLDLVSPDPLGYLLVAIGAGLLAPANRTLGRARIIAWLLVPLSLAETVQPKVVLLEQGDLTYYVNPYWPAVLAAIIVDMVLLWHVLKGLARLARGRCRMSLSSHVNQALGLYLGVGVLQVIVMLVCLGVPQLEYFFGLPLAGLAIISRVFAVTVLLDAVRLSRQLTPYEDAAALPH